MDREMKGKWATFINHRAWGQPDDLRVTGATSLPPNVQPAPFKSIDQRPGCVFAGR